MSAVNLAVGEQSVWVVDSRGFIWFRPEVTVDCPAGDEHWWQVVIKFTDYFQAPGWRIIQQHILIITNVGLTFNMLFVLMYCIVPNLWPPPILQ